jgi:hypothetical protein
VVKYQPVCIENENIPAAASLATHHFVYPVYFLPFLLSTTAMSGAELPIAVVSFFFQAFAGCIQGG